MKWYILILIGLIVTTNVTAQILEGGVFVVEIEQDNSANLDGSGLNLDIVNDEYYYLAIPLPESSQNDINSDFIAIGIFFGSLTLLFSFMIFILNNNLYKLLALDISLGMVTADFSIAEIIVKSISSNSIGFINMITGLYTISLIITILSIVGTFIFILYRLLYYLRDLPKLRRQSNSFRGR